MGHEKWILGIEGGATKTDWVFIKHSGKNSKVVNRGQLTSANLRLISDRSLQKLLKELPRNPTHVGVFLAGCITEQDRNGLMRLSRKVWPDAKISVGSDRDSSLAAAFRERDGIVVVCGTGSAITGRRNGRIEKAGGRGHILGDKGGGYLIALDGLRLALETYDLTHRVSPLAERILLALSLNRMEDLVGWVQGADKMSIARLAPLMFECARKGDSAIKAVLQSGSKTLARYTASVARRLKWNRPSVQLLGSVFQHQPMYSDLFQSALRKFVPQAALKKCNSSGAIGAAWLAAKEILPSHVEFSGINDEKGISLSDAATEKANPRSAKIDTMSTLEMVDLFVAEEEYVSQALQLSRKHLQKAVDLITRAVAKGGRLFYVGAGTSGRLGILDASEIPPTFGESPDRVQGIMAGGVAAMHSSVEGAEDRREEGAITMAERGVRSADVVCGITASGQTPFVLGALEKAKQIGAKTILLTCNPGRIQKGIWDLEIDLSTGPELITGSTRLKAGTATKVALNIMSTCAMIRLGKIRGNFMTHMKPANMKLRDRAVRLVSVIRGWSYEEALRRLNRTSWNVHRALRLK